MCFSMATQVDLKHIRPHFYKYNIVTVSNRFLCILCEKGEIKTVLYLTKKISTMLVCNVDDFTQNVLASSTIGENPTLSFNTPNTTQTKNPIRRNFKWI